MCIGKSSRVRLLFKMHSFPKVSGSPDALKPSHIPKDGRRDSLAHHTDRWSREYAVLNALCLAFSLFKCPMIV